ncbi:hypothetical protein BH10PSE14_BH10PSE14_27430 [soil metagenome]
MHMFEIQSNTGAKASVFAQSPDEALALFWVWHDLHHGEFNQFSLDRRDASDAGAGEQQLREALALGQAGIGRLHPERGWEIIPAASLAEEDS